MTFPEWFEKQFGLPTHDSLGKANVQDYFLAGLEKAFSAGYESRKEEEHKNLTRKCWRCGEVILGGLS